MTSRQVSAHIIQTFHYINTVRFSPEIFSMITKIIGQEAKQMHNSCRINSLSSILLHERYIYILFKDGLMEKRELYAILKRE